MELNINISGQEKVFTTLNNTRMRVSDLRPVWETVTEDLEKETKEIYASEGSSGEHGQWASLSTEYAKWKEKNYPGRPLLVLSGDLYVSLQNKGKDNIKILTAQQLKWGSSKKVGEWNLGLLHQKGTRKMPARMIMDYTKNFMVNILKILHKYIYTRNK